MGESRDRAEAAQKTTAAALIIHGTNRNRILAGNLILRRSPKMARWLPRSGLYSSLHGLSPRPRVTRREGMIALQARPISWQIPYSGKLGSAAFEVRGSSSANHLNVPCRTLSSRWGLLKGKCREPQQRGAALERPGPFGTSPGWRLTSGAAPSLCPVQYVSKCCPEGTISVPPVSINVRCLTELVTS